ADVILSNAYAVAYAPRELSRAEYELPHIVAEVPHTPAQIRKAVALFVEQSNLGPHLMPPPAVYPSDAPTLGTALQTLADSSRVADATLFGGYASLAHASMQALSA